MKLRSFLVRNILASNPLLRSTPSQWRPALMPYRLIGAPMPRFNQLCGGTACGTTKPARQTGNELLGSVQEQNCSGGRVLKCHCMQRGHSITDSTVA